MGEGPRALGTPPTHGDYESRGLDLEHCMARGVVILECPRTPQSEVWARSYGVLNGALPRDSAQQCECCGEGQHTPRSDAWESRLFGGA